MNKDRKRSIFIMNGEKVYVSGEVKYSDDIYRIACNGIIQDVGNKESLVTLDNIDGDGGATVFVLNKYINKLN